MDSIDGGASFSAVSSFAPIPVQGEHHSGEEPCGEPECLALLLIPDQYSGLSSVIVIVHVAAIPGFLHVIPKAIRDFWLAQSPSLLICAKHTFVIAKNLAPGCNNS